MADPAPGASVAATPSPRTLGIAGLLRPYWWQMAVALVAVAGEAGAALLEPWPLKIVLDNLLPHHPLPGWMTPVAAWLGNGPLAILYLAVSAVAVIAVAGACCSYANTRLTSTVGQWVMHDLRRTLYHHIHRLSLAEHDGKRTGDLIGRVTKDIESVQDFVTSALLGIVTNVLTLAGIIAVMLYLNWRFTLISLSIAPVLFLVVYGFTRRIKQASRDVRKKESELVSMVAEVFSSIRVVKAFAREDYEEARFERQSLENVETALRARTLKMLLSPVVEVIVAIGTCLMLWYGARMVIAGDLTAGALVVFLLYLGKMYKPMRDLSKMTDTVSKAGVGFERVREVLETEGGVRNRRHARAARPFKGAIAFEHVSFGYASGQTILDDVSFAIAPGQVAAFVGPTGGGKTTVVNLIARFYDPVSGTVRIDGTDIRDVTIRSLRDQISFVLQDTLLFQATVWQNIAYGRPEASRAEIIRAATLANAHEFIEEMPAGYDTEVGERGVTLSGGQRQRIAIARAVIRNTPILILDEPTSGLDVQSEQVVFEALDRLMQGKTTIVIAHHLATILRADTIFVVKEHRLAERGTHAELMAGGGFYAELHAIQSAAQAAALAV
jgi:ATP-binding cassette subfamily B protein